jgi:hypothetical protein
MPIADFSVRHKAPSARFFSGGLVDTAVLAAIISGAVALAAAAVTYLLTKKRDREAEWRKLKLDYYRELVAAIPPYNPRRPVAQPPQGGAASPPATPL